MDIACCCILYWTCVNLAHQDDVEFHVNVDSVELTRLLSSALACLHTMVCSRDFCDANENERRHRLSPWQWNEHFGISCVESMASGVVLIAHKSGGPQSDIVCPQDGPRERVAFSQLRRDSDWLQVNPLATWLSRLPNTRSAWTKYSNPTFHLMATQMMSVR